MAGSVLFLCLTLSLLGRRRFVERPHALAAALGIFLVVSMEALSAGFVSDDFFFFGASAKGWQFLSGWRHEVLPNVGAFRPLTLLSYDIDRFYELGPLGLRFSSYAIHCAAAVALYRLLMVLEAGWGASALAAALFLLHPVHHEAIYWISGRPYLLGALFGLIALECTVRERPLLAFLFSSAAMLSHESLIVLPIVAGVLGYKRIPLSSMFALAVPSAIVFGFSVRDTMSVTALDLDRIPINGAALVLRLMTLPRDSTLEPDWLSVSFGVTALAIAVCLFARRGASTDSLLLRMMGGTFAAFLPFLAFPGYADRFAYMPSTFFCSALAGLIASLALDAARSALVAAVSGAWTFQLYDHARDWVAAGTLAQKILDSASSVAFSHTDRERVEFRDVPRMHGRAYVFMTYFDLALAERLPPLPPSAPGVAVVIARWNPSTEAFDLEASK